MRRHGIWLGDHLGRMHVHVLVRANLLVKANIRQFSVRNQTFTSTRASLSVWWSNQSQDAVTAAAKIKQARDNALTKMREEGDAHAAVPYERS